MHLLTEQIDKAISDFDRALEINPGFPIAYVQKLYTDYRAALEKNNQEKIQNVINSFEQAVDKFPDCVETYALFAQVLFIPFAPLSTCLGHPGGQSAQL